jgi:predicted nucleic acid-binding Zn ribbon protein
MVEVLRNTIAGMQSGGQIRQSLALAYWPRVVGALAARSSTAVEVRNRILFIRTKSSVWSHELSMQKTSLVRSLNRLLEGSVIEDIKFRTDGTPWAEVIESSDTPTSNELDAVLLSPEEHDMLRFALGSLKTVGSAHAREALAARITMEAKLRHWRLERGWRVCLRCTAVHKTAEPICPICRLTP